jgi:hypothetical protein
MACLDFIAESAYEKPLSASLYKFVIKAGLDVPVLVIEGLNRHWLSPK